MPLDTEALAQILGVIIDALVIVVGALESVRRRIIYEKKREKAKEAAHAWERETPEELCYEDALAEVAAILGERTGQE